MYPAASRAHSWAICLKPAAFLAFANSTFTTIPESQLGMEDLL